MHTSLSPRYYPCVCVCLCVFVYTCVCVCVWVCQERLVYTWTHTRARTQLVHRQMDVQFCTLCVCVCVCVRAQDRFSVYTHLSSLTAFPHPGPSLASCVVSRLCARGKVNLQRWQYFCFQDSLICAIWNPDEPPVSLTRYLLTSK